MSWANREMRRVKFEKGLQTEKMGRFNPPKPERKCWPTESALEQTMEMHGNKTRTWKTAEARRKKGRLKTTAAILTLSRAENELQGQNSEKSSGAFHETCSMVLIRSFSVISSFKRTSRMISASGVPPGSRVKTASGKWFLRSWKMVFFPEPSIPVSVTYFLSGILLFSIS